MERTISVWSDRNIRDQLWRWSTLTGLVISVGRTEMTLSIWQNVVPSTALLYPAYKNNNQPECTVPLGKWNFRNFELEFLLNGKRPRLPFADFQRHFEHVMNKASVGKSWQSGISLTGLGRSLQQLAMVSEWIRELQNLTTLKGAVSRLSCSLFNRELEEQRSWATDVNGKRTFCIIGQWFGWNSWVNRLCKRKQTEQYKFVSAKAYKKEESLTSGWRASLKNVFA